MITKLICAVCKYDWIPRIDSPKVCPKCHSSKWNNSTKKAK